MANEGVTARRRRCMYMAASSTTTLRIHRGLDCGFYRGLTSEDRGCGCALVRDVGGWYRVVTSGGGMGLVSRVDESEYIKVGL
jgi:hypothetical protein